jgi:hypothetical protein
MADTLFKTYEAIGNREDLIDLITNISPIDTPMLSRFGRSVASNTYHEWQTDSINAASSTGLVEGADTDAPSLTYTTRVGNYTQISNAIFRVSNTQMAMNSAGRANEYEYQAAKALKELSRDMEASIHDSTLVSGGATTARQLKGVRSFITTNVDTGTGASGGLSGWTLTSARLNAFLKGIWTAGGTPNAIYVNGYQKIQIANFTTPQTRYEDAAKKKYTAVVNVYDSVFGPIDIILDRYATATELLALEDDKWRVAYLRPVKKFDLPDGGGGPKGKVECEFTLEALNEAASGKMIYLTVLA